MKDSIVRLDWDSDFLGFSVCRIDSASVKGTKDLAGILALAKQKGFRLCYFSFPHDTETLSEIARNNKGKHADEKITYTRKDFPDFDNDSLSDISEYVSNDNAEQMYDLAIQSSHESRFRTDLNFSEGTCDRMYRIWMDKSINGELADKVYVHTIGGKITGMITLYSNENTGYIGLIGVDSTERRKNIGGKLMNKAYEYFASNMIGVIEVDTQMRNTEACRFYEKNGFAIKSIMHIYHFWL